MIKSIEVCNFKNIEKARIALRPITILCGPNSSGKSSFMQSLLMLKQTFIDLSGMHTLSTRGSVVDLGSFEDLISRHDVSKKLEYEFTIIPSEISYSRGWIGTVRSRLFFIRNLTVKVKYEYIKELEKIELCYIAFVANNDVIIESRKNDDGTYRFVHGSKRNDKRLSWTNPKVHSLTEFLSPQPLMDSLLGKELSSFKSDKLNIIRRMFLAFIEVVSVETDKMNYLGPFRQIPNRYYTTGSAMPTDIGYRGERSVDYLSYKKLSGGVDTIKFVQTWLQRLGYASKFDIKTIKSVIKTTSLINKSTGVESTLVDVGFGVSQVLPVIIAVCRHDGGIHFFEQPEIHLHPKSQGDIADLFIENMAGHKSFVVETHSEHFINRMRLRVAEGKINKDDVAIYYISCGEDGFVSRRVDIADDGSYEMYPDGFFDESYQESKKIMMSRIVRNG